MVWLYLFLKLQIKLIMWNLVSASKLTEEKVRRKNYEKHRSKVNSMKAIIRIKEPEQPQFVYVKPKLEMSRRDKLIEIDRQNQILLNKMQIIKSAAYPQNKLRPEAQHLKSLNQHVVNQQLEQIYNENKRICQKLLKVESHYPTFETIDKAQKLERVRLNISENARRVMSARSLYTRPHSSTSRSSKFYRSRVNKYDNEGNSSQQKINILYKMSSQADLRPESAPIYKRGSRPYSSEKPQHPLPETETQRQGQFASQQRSPQQIE